MDKLKPVEYAEMNEWIVKSEPTPESEILMSPPLLIVNHSFRQKGNMSRVTRSRSVVMDVTTTGAQTTNVRPEFQGSASPISSMFENAQVYPEETEPRTPTTLVEETAAPMPREERARLGHPPVFTISFHGGPEADTARFISRCERFFAAADTDKEDQATKAATAFHGEALAWWQSLPVKPTSWERFTFALERKYDSIGRKLRLEYEVKSVLQGEDENAYEFLERKRAVAKVCTTAADPLELARTIQGLMTPRDQERTDRLRWTTLDELVDAVRALELRQRREDVPMPKPMPLPKQYRDPTPADRAGHGSCGPQCRRGRNQPPRTYNEPPPPIPQAPRGQETGGRVDHRQRREDRRPQQYENRYAPRRENGPLRCWTCGGPHREFACPQRRPRQ